MGSPRGAARPFTIEKRLRPRRSSDGFGTLASGSGKKSEPADGTALQEVLDEIQALRDDVAVLKTQAKAAAQAAAPPPPPPPPPTEAQISEAARIEHEKGLAMRAELKDVSEAIDRTKTEIAALRRKTHGDDRLETASFELDAVVRATEVATDTILGCAEQIEEMAGRVASHDSDGFNARIADDLTEQVQKIFEACNFQDITGQRINKVVTALKYVDDRIASMIGIWGEDAVAAAETEDEEAKAKQADEYEKYLHGPKGKNESDTISQDDIDALFD